MVSNDVMQPAIVANARRQPQRALVRITNSIFGPGVAEITNVMPRNSHHVVNAIGLPAFA
jgi:hypothetical protein